MAASTRTRVFDHVVCGVDGSVQALEAARQARGLLAADGSSSSSRSCRRRAMRS
jgi:hypothetical protein